ncbi:MAG: glycosyltransferase [Deltaproteobacteria bacterium]|nr:glycosyltransferase [Deltaproteobacteria bacterium]
MEPQPRITIVTPSFNQGQYLEDTLVSVLNQNYPNLEYIVIDGGSSDNSVDIIRTYSHRLAWWTSEKDQGQSDALNKGFAKATGEIFGWINSDDLLLPDALHRVALQYQKSPQHLVIGDTILFSSHPPFEILQRQFGVTFENMVMNWIGRRMTWCQPGTFFPAQAFRNVGGLDSSLRYVFDRDLMCRLLKDSAVAYVREPIAKFRLHGESKTVAESPRWVDEQILVTKRYSKSFPDLLDDKIFLECHLCSRLLPALRSWSQGEPRGGIVKELVKLFAAYPLLAIGSPRFWQALLRSVTPRPLLATLDRNLP